MEPAPSPQSPQERQLNHSFGERIPGAINGGQGNHSILIGLSRLPVTIWPKLRLSLSLDCRCGSKTPSCPTFSIIVEIFPSRALRATSAFPRDIFQKRLFLLISRPATSAARQPQSSHASRRGRAIMAAGLAADGQRSLPVIAFIQDIRPHDLLLRWPSLTLLQAAAIQSGIRTNQAAECHALRTSHRLSSINGLRRIC